MELDWHGVILVLSKYVLLLARPSLRMTCQEARSQPTNVHQRQHRRMTKKKPPKGSSSEQRSTLVKGNNTLFFTQQFAVGGGSEAV